MLVGVLGPVEVWDDEGRALAVGGPLVRALLAMLALDAGHIVSTERLIDGLYGEDPPAGAANALQSQVSRLRRGLRDPALVEGLPSGYRLNLPREDVDAHRFEALVREGRGREALKLWRGPALDGVAAPFARLQATRLEERRDAVIEDRAEADLAAGEYARTIDELRTLVANRPLRERARGLLMRALHAAGRQGEALELYEQGRRLLAEELGADPSAELTEVHLAILRGETGTRQAPKRLPAMLTTFVGRDEELARVGKMLAEGRLVTLLGPGGAGKTRLALEAAGQAEGEACFVDLSEVDEAEVPLAVLGSLGLRETGMLPGGAQADPVDRLLTALEGRRVLLVLDNCEHVVDAAARLAHRLLGALPELRVLATGREALGLTGESLRPLPPLELPPDGADPAEAAGYPAVRLFADRAAAVRPDFEITPGNAAAVVGICAALDGLPLAIELAAARLRSLPVEEVARRLDDRFRLLSRGDRAAAPRHRTLRAVVEWSWDLLDEDERTLARRLSVFAGGATLDAAGHVCAMDDADDLLAGLVEKSLLQTDGVRYRMLGTVRAFCAERLDKAGEAERITAAHAAYFLDLARRADPHLRGPEQLEWLARLAGDHADLLAALRRSIRADPVTALRLAAALSWYWWLRGRAEGGPLCVALLDEVGLEPPGGCGEEYALCVTNAVSAGAVGSRVSAALDVATRLMAGLRRQLEYPATMVLWALTAGPERSEVDAIMAQVGDDAWCLALLDMSNGMMARFRGDVDEAERCSELALRGFRALGDRWGVANTLDPLAQLAERRGDHARAMTLIGEALELLGELDALEDRADLLCRRAEVHLHTGELDAASADFRVAADLARRAGAGDKVASARCGLGDVARHRGDVGEARRLFEEALSGTSTGRFIASAVNGAAQIGLGRIALSEGDTDTARTRLREALRLTIDHPVFMERGDAVLALAGVALAEGDGERAALLAGAAGALHARHPRSDPDFVRLEPLTRALIGDAAYEAAHARGAALPPEEAVAAALAD
jgi:predicted ATPase/DNA-binding SARP family transcriptional activator